MTVKELIAELQKYDENIAVKIFDSEWGYLDVEEVRHAKGSHIDREQGIRIDYNYIAIS
jgi:hypothetical protein